MATETSNESTDPINDALENLKAEEVADDQVTPEAEPETPESVDSTEADTEVDDQPEPEAAPESTEPAAEVSPLIKEATEFYGMSQEEAEALGDNLELFMAKMDQQASQLMRERAGAEKSEAEPAPKAEPAPQPKATASDIAKLDKFELKVDRDIHDESTLGVFDTFAKETNDTRERFNDLREQLKEQKEIIAALGQLAVANHSGLENITKRASEDTNLSITQGLDDFFAGLGPEYADIYGKAPMSHLKDTDPKAVSRNELYAQAAVLEDVRKQKGLPVGTLNQRLQAAARIIHPDKIKQAARQDVEADLKKAKKSGIARPSGSAKRPADREARAMAAIEKFMPKLGL